MLTSFTIIFGSKFKFPPIGFSFILKYFSTGVLSPNFTWQALYKKQILLEFIKFILFILIFKLNYFDTIILGFLLFLKKSPTFVSKSFGFILSPLYSKVKYPFQTFLKNEYKSSFIDWPALA